MKQLHTLYLIKTTTSNLSLNGSAIDLEPQKILISQQLKIATHFFHRMKGLLGTRELKEDQMLLIKMCNSIHTFFMNYPIDCVFLDDQLVIQSLKPNINPWRATLPVISANSVIEMPSGFIKKYDLKIGDKFYVGT